MTQGGIRTHTLPHHLGLFYLKVGCTVDQSTNLGVVVQLFKELCGFHVVSNLGELYTGQVSSE